MDVTVALGSLPGKVRGYAALRAVGPNEAEDLRGGRMSTVPWLQDFSLGRPYRLNGVSEQIAAARRQHAAGLLSWNPQGISTQDALSPALQ